jgi:Uma2 family endonuclease
MVTSPDVLPVVAPADSVPGPPQGCWTYLDYAALPDDGQRYEIVDGVLYMTPAPGTPHQHVSKWFVHYLTTHVELAGLGRVYHAPCDVELAPNVVVQPDIIVVLQANLNIITPTRLIGVPDLVIEILSPGSAGYDRRRKQDAYARAGLREYWLADPAARTVEVLRLEEGEYRSLGVFQGKALLPSTVIPNLPVMVEQFFA